MCLGNDNDVAACPPVQPNKQVLPGRTHPLNNMSSCGGYVLTGIKVTHNPDPRGVVPTARIPDMAKRHKKKRYKRT